MKFNWGYMIKNKNPHTEEMVSSMGLQRFADDYFGVYEVISEKHIAPQVKY